MKRKKVSKSLFAGFLALTMCVTMGSGVFAADTDEISEAPLPSEFLQEYTVTDNASYAFVEEADKEELLAEAESFPETYDLRDLNYVTPIKLQNPFGSCWAFAAAATAETSLISSGLADVDTIDLSERHISVFTRTPVLDKNSSQYTEGYLFDESASERMAQGGNAILSSALFATGAGPVEENEDPELIYKGTYGVVDQRVMSNGLLEDFSYSADDDWEISYSKRYNRDYALRESVILPSNYDIDTNKYAFQEATVVAIKEQLMQGRAVNIGFLADQASPGDEDVKPMMLSDDWAHYGKAEGIANHAVTIVGWDDTIGSEGSPVQFLENNQPEHPGAWLVKNSWGSGEREFPNRGNGVWGIRNEKGEGTGYFWLSYYDHSICSEETLIFEEANDYEIQQYDLMPPMSMETSAFDEPLKFANRFHATSNGTLKQISYYTTHPNTTVSYEVYLLRGDAQAADLGLKVAEGEITHEFGGFHKIDLDTPAVLMKDQVYSVVLKMKRSDGKYCLTVPASPSKEYKSVVNNGESVVYMDGTWMDLSDSELTQKLFPQLAASQDVRDNFPIKTYVDHSDNTTGLDGYYTLNGKTALFFTEQNKHSTLKLRASGLNLPKNLKAKWVLDNKIYDVMMKEVIDEGPLVDITGLDEEGCGLKATLNVRKDGDVYKCGHSYLYIYLSDADTGKEVGTLVTTVSSARMGIDGVVLKEYAETGVQPDFVYNGQAYEPELYVNDYASNTLVAGRDYQVEYKNNIKVGAAEAKAIVNEDYDVSSGITSTFFAIRPAAAVLKEVTVGPASLTVSVQDQSESGLTGYKVEYREKGTEEWQSKDFKGTATELTVTGLTGGKEYEVRVCGYLQFEELDPEWFFIKERYDGDPSEVLTSEPVLPSVEPVLKAGWNFIDGKWYYLDEQLNKKTGWLADNGKWYYLDPSTGAMQTGWICPGGVWYYLSASGAMVTGWQQIGGYWYFFYNSGAMAAKEWVNTYWLSASGAWTYLPRGTWKQDLQGWWFGDTSGWYAKNETVKIDGTNYNFNAAGYLVQ